MMQFDDLLRELGEFGPYQRLLYVLLCIPAISSAIQSISLVVFLFAVPEHRCAISSLINDTYEVQNDYHEQIINMTIPIVSGYQGISEYSSCEIYNKPHKTWSSHNNMYRNVTGIETETCHAWVYDVSVFETTISQSMDMVCDKKSYVSHFKMLNMAGQMLGILISGPLSDMFGRKTVIVVGMLITNILSVCMAWVTSFYVLVPVLIVMTASSSTQYLASFVFGLELVGQSKRMLAGIGINFFWSAGNMIVALSAYLLRDWKIRQLVLSLPTFIYLYLFFIPESPRWLISKGRDHKARKTLVKMARWNKVEITSQDLENVTCKEEPGTEKYWELLKSPVLVRRMFIIFYNWMAVGMGFYGLSMNVNNLSGNVYLNFFLFVLVEACAYVACLFLLNRLGRKRMLCGSMITAGLACILTFLPILVSDKPEEWIINLLACVGNTCVSAGFATLYVFTAELIPTSSRNFGLAMSSICCRVGSLVSPYINDLTLYIGGRYSQILPMLIFGSVTVLAGLFSFLLPETLKTKLPETVLDAERLGSKRDNRFPDKENVELGLLTDNLAMKDRATSDSF